MCRLMAVVHISLNALKVIVPVGLTGGARDLLDLLLSDAAAAIPPAAWAVADETPALPAADAAAATADGAAGGPAAAQVPQQGAAPMETEGPGSGSTPGPTPAGEGAAASFCTALACRSPLVP